MAILETKHLVKYFDIDEGTVHAVDDVNIKIERGETLGVVGESGCGKSTLGRTVLRLTPATSGQVFFQGDDILKYSESRMKALRREMQVIFQDPYSSLNPRLTVESLIAESLKVNKICHSRSEISDRVNLIMRTVGLDERLVNTYPHELDGGRRQRIGIARALILEPKIIVCDEPVSALDVSIQAQILNLMMDIQQNMGLSYMFVTHDLSVVKHISNEIAVMYLGKIVELASSDALFDNPLHPYTRALLNAVPVPKLKSWKGERKILRGEVSSPIDPEPNCRFAQRCQQCADICRLEEPPLKEIEPHHFVACHLS
jgi:peptide/nickel transport system ATP-binding protein